MPLYEYQCKTCGHYLEVLQSMRDDPLQICPQCRQPHLNKLISKSAFQLKGEGWYVTDFRDKGKKPEKKPETTTKPVEAGAATTATETKVEKTPKLDKKE